MRVAFRVDAGPQIGGGHLMRCLVLARQLAAGGAAVCFLTNSAGFPVDLAALGFSTIEVTTPHSPIGPMLAQAFPSAGADLLVVDHYGIPEEVERAARTQARVILAFDDMPTRRHHCDLLVDQNFGVDPHEYTSWIPAGARVLAGSQFALLREEFVHARSTALHRRSAEEPAGMMVCFGMNDQEGFTLDVVSALRSIGYFSRINVVIGSNSASVAELRMLANADNQIALAIDPEEVAPTMIGPAVAIGAGGSMHWERCCLGLPSVCVVLAENQRKVSERLMQAGAIELGPDIENFNAFELAQKAVLLESDKVRREEMSMRAMVICDGLGADRLVRAIRSFM